MNCIHITGPDLRRCRRKARYFGKWTSGELCLEHAAEFADRHGVDQFHHDDRLALEAALRSREAADEGK